MEPDPVLHVFARAVQGLLMPSETDAPFEPFRWPGGAEASAADAVGRRRRGERLVVSADDFFGPLAGTDDGPRFAALRRVLESELSGLTVVRVGRTRIGVYCIGRTRGGDWAGVRTSVVET